MSLHETLVELRRGDVELKRREQVVVALRAVTADVRHEVHVRLRVVALHLAAVEVRERRARFRLRLA